MASQLPMVILINGYSASASEILTLALKENRCPQPIQKVKSFSAQCNVITLGEKTFGKGTIQSLQNLSFGGSLKLTVGKWYSPHGDSIQGTGIMPDIEYEFDAQEYYQDGVDIQLEAAQELFSQ